MYKDQRNALIVAAGLAAVYLEDEVVQETIAEMLRADDAPIEAAAFDRAAHHEQLYDSLRMGLLAAVNDVDDAPDEVLLQYVRDAVQSGLELEELRQRLLNAMFLEAGGSSAIATLVERALNQYRALRGGLLSALNLSPGEEDQTIVAKAADVMGELGALRTGLLQALGSTRYDQTTDKEMLAEVRALSTNGTPTPLSVTRQLSAVRELELLGWYWSIKDGWIKPRGTPVIPCDPN